MALRRPTAQRVLVPFRYDTILELAVAAATVEARTRSNSITDPWNNTYDLAPPNEEDKKRALILKAFV